MMRLACIHNRVDSEEPHWNCIFSVQYQLFYSMLFTAGVAETRETPRPNSSPAERRNDTIETVNIFLAQCIVKLPWLFWLPRYFSQTEKAQLHNGAWLRSSEQISQSLILCQEKISEIPQSTIRNVQSPHLCVVGLFLAPQYFPLLLPLSNGRLNFCQVSGVRPVDIGGSVNGIAKDWIQMLASSVSHCAGKSFTSLMTKKISPA